MGSSDSLLELGIEMRVVSVKHRSTSLCAE
jgi:hypothetical protein